MRTAVGALAVVAAASGASAFAPQSSFVGRAPALCGAAIAPAQAQLAAPDLRSRDVSRKAISMDLDPWLVAAPGLVALGVAIQNQMSPGILSVRCISAMFVLCVAFALPFPRRQSGESELCAASNTVTAGAAIAAPTKTAPSGQQMLDTARVSPAGTSLCIAVRFSDRFRHLTAFLLCAHAAQLPDMERCPADQGPQGRCQAVHYLWPLLPAYGLAQAH